MKLTRWDTKETIYESEHDTIKECVVDAIKKGVNLFRVDLIDANMAGANMAGANMTCANMIGADMTCANMAGANMIDADMRGAILTDADMVGANLKCANMTGAVLRGAILTDADMAGADLDFSSWPLWRGSCEVKLDKKNNERFAYYCMVNMSAEVLADFLQNPVEFANRFAERKGISKIKRGEK